MTPNLEGPQGHTVPLRTSKRPLPTREKLRRTRSLVVLIVVLAIYSQTLADWLTLGLYVAAMEVTLMGYCMGPKVGYYSYMATVLMLNPIILRLLASWADITPHVSLQQMMLYAFAFAVHLSVDRLLGFGGPYPLRFFSVLEPASL